jgi:four helix bundle protein
LGKISTYKDLIVWQKSMQLVKDVYQLSKTLPNNEKFNLISQITRSSISIPTNIAEGWGRESKKSYVQFLKTSRGSLYELETQKTIINDLQFCKQEIFEIISNKITEIIKMLKALIKSINTKTETNNEHIFR